MPTHSLSPINESQFLKIVNDDSVKRTYVIFSSVDIEPGKFMFWRVMATISGSKIFLNDENNGWYVHGIPTLGANVEESTQALLEIIKKTEPQEVILLGPSMGGYAAMLYGCLLKPMLPGIKIRCLSFGGEFLLYERETRSKLLSKKPPNPKYADLRPLLKSSELAVTHVFGDTDLVDLYQASLISTYSNIITIAVNNAPHAVSTFIGQNFNLIEFIRSFGENGAPINIPCSVEYKKNGFCESLFNGHIALLDNDIETALEKLKFAASLWPTHSVTRHKYGIALYQAGEIEDALFEQKSALQLCPSLDHAHYHLGLLLTKLGRKSEAISAYQECVSIQPRHFSARFALTELLIQMEAFRDGFDHISYILNHDPKNKRAISLLEILSAKSPKIMENKKSSPEISLIAQFSFEKTQGLPLSEREIFRSDTTSSLIKSRTAILHHLKPCLSESENLIQSESRRGNWINVAALGRYITASWPLKARGYLAQFDGMFNLGLRKDALDSIELAEKTIGLAPLLTHRKMRAQNYMRHWTLAVSSFFADPLASKDERCLREAFSASVQMMDFNASMEILEFARTHESLFNELSKELARCVSESSVAFENWHFYENNSAETALEQAVSNNDYRSIEVGYWEIFRSGRRDTSFFDAATQPLPYESGYDNRVFFFRHAAYSAHPTNLDYAKKLARCFLHWRLIDEAHQLLENHVRDGANDSEYLVLRCRARDSVKGASTTPLMNLHWDQISSNSFATFDAIRQANLAVWNGNTELASLAKSAISRYSTSQAAIELLQLSQPPKISSSIRMPKVALCISGQLRAFEENCSHIQKSIVAPLKADVFIHTWDQQPSSPPELRIIQRFIGNELTQALPSHLRHISAFRKRFPTATQKLTEPTFTEVTNDRISSLIKCKKISIESEKIFLDRVNLDKAILHQGKPNQAKMFYKIHACNNLRLATELETNEDYDVVIRMRPDLRIRFPEIAQFISACAANPNLVYVNSTHGDGISDLFAIASGSAMNAYSSVWKFLIKYKKFDYIPGFSNRPAETLLGQHLMASGLDVRILPTEEITLLSNTPIESIDITNELNLDSENYGDPSEVENFISAYKIWRTQNLKFQLS